MFNEKNPYRRKLKEEIKNLLLEATDLEEAISKIFKLIEHEFLGDV